MNGNNKQDNVLDPFVKFWQDAFSKIPAGGFTPGQPPSADMVQQMRRAFFDTLAKYCDEFMRSPQFLDAMKQSMDQSLAFRKQVNQFLSGALQGMQMTTQDDMGEVLGTLRAIENNLLHRVDEMLVRIERLETGGGRKPAARAKPARRAGKPARPAVASARK